MVPASGTITLPPEFRDAEVVILETTSKRPPEDRDEFWCPKSLDEIAVDQGGAKICTNPDEYFGSLAFLWDSEEEIESFLQNRRDEI
jgi:hypothetical protein